MYAFALTSISTPTACILVSILGHHMQRHYREFILVINQLDAQNLFYNKFISCVYMFRAPYAVRQEVKILLYSLWYHHTYRCDGIITPIGVMIPEAV